MLSWPSLFIFAGTIVSQINLCISSKSTSCGQGNYYDSRKNECKKCSVCPINHIIKTPCSTFEDQECSPFSFDEFSEFDTSVLRAYPTGHINPGVDEEDNIKPKRSHNKVTDDHGPTTVEKEDREYWKTLAFALIGLLSVLIVVATVVVLVACRRLQKATVIKQPDEGDMEDADSGYVVIRAIRNITDPRPVNAEYNVYSRKDYDAHPPLLSPSYNDRESTFDPSAHLHSIPGRLCFLPKVYKPQRRLLTYDTDDVFESEDSGGSYVAPVKTKLHTIAESSVSFSSKASTMMSKDMNDQNV
ncbi:unnamed protein product [Lymnaea stagnalis]|uniref:TNFR-Cys domain-containing protein n=1 Tax=Lymnaea stagnalis TaxID=6523 RepID=A0AAV2ITN2_LYMST